ncbi:hypothetical protein PG999_010880 [Apiospora kogelbergensis]|uniref:Uncharacterized protein n=2 Tax=Apiospora kogelbergensis TaxID=1337665 RepID=A0AAW0QM64_9PEZI
MAPLNEKAQLLRRWLDDLPPIDEGAAAQVISANHDSIQARDDEGKDVNRHLEVYQDDSSNDGSSDSGKGPPNKNKKTSSLWLSTPTTLPTQTTSMVGPPVSATNTKIATGPTITSTMRPNPVQSTMRPSSVVESTSIVLSTEIATKTTWVSVPIVTTAPLLDPITSQPRKGIDQPTTTSATALPQVTGEREYEPSRHRNQSNNSLDETGEHALIAAGSIGAFILVCFVSWIIYRTLKKPGSSGPELWSKLRGRKSPDNEQGGMNSMQNAGYYGDEKIMLARSNTGRSQQTMMQRPMAPGSVVMIPAEEYATLTKNQALTLSDYNSTMRSRMPDAYFNQSELARQPSDAYDPAQRQAYRASDLSSLSSGFGDGDIIVPESALKPPPQPSNMTLQPPAAAGRFSWMSRRAGERDTVYTATSEDRPARYRSVNSWVNQQMGRIKRADERKQPDDGTPPVPGIPNPATSSHLTPAESR